MQTSANKQTRIRTHYEVVKVLDGDGLIVKNIFTNDEEEVRLLGIDAPEIKLCRKLKQDEREVNISGTYLIELGYKSMKFLLKKAKPQKKHPLLKKYLQLKKDCPRQKL